MLSGEHTLTHGKSEFLAICDALIVL